MELNSYQNEAARTAIFPIDKGWDYLLCSLPEELGEFLSIFAKAARKGRAQQLTPAEKEAAAYELGDLFWNVALAARQLGLSLEVIAAMNLNKLNSREKRGVIEGEGDHR